METQGSGMALGHLRYDGEAVWYDGGMTETGVIEDPLELLGKESQPGPLVWACLGTHPIKSFMASSKN